MMAITVPRIQRAEPSPANPPNDRVNYRVPDQGVNILANTHALATLGNEAIDTYRATEDAKIDQLSTKAEYDYTVWTNQELGKLKAMEGDPTDAYAEFDKRAKEKYDSILNERPGLSDRVRESVNARLDKTVRNMNIGVLKQRGQQQVTYDHNVFEAGLKLKKDALPVVAGYIRKGDDSSFFMHDQGIDDITTAIAKQGLKTGTVKKLTDEDSTEVPTHVYRDDDGSIVKVKMTDIAKQQVAKERSEAIKNSINVMISGGQVEEARMMQERYKKYLDPIGAAKINDKFKTADRKIEAYRFIDKLEGKGGEASLEEIDKIEDPELRSEVLKIKDAADSKREHLRDRQDRSNHDYLAQHVFQVMNSDNPYHGVADLEADPKYKAVWDNMSAKSKESVLQMISEPKTSNPKSQTKVNELLTGNTEESIEGMSYEKFQRDYLTGLSGPDRNKAVRQFEKLRDPSASEQRSSYKRADELVKKYLLQSEKIVKNDFGRISGDDEMVLLKAQDKMTTYLSDLKTLPNEEQLNKLAKELAASEVEERTFRPENIIKSKVNAGNTSPGSTAVKTGNVTSSANALVGLSALDVVNYKLEYQRINSLKSAPSSGDAGFLNWVQGKR